MSKKQTRFQKFETEVIHRSKITGAPYNPRVIDENAKKRLASSLRKHGLVEPLVWNRRTGTLVGGHQRLSILDALEKGEDYELTVSVVDVDEKEEARLNVQLNNPSMQGDWDAEALAKLSVDLELDLEKDFGFTDLDVAMLFEGDDRFSVLFQDNTDVTATKGILGDIKKDREEMSKKLQGEQSADFYFTVVCESQEDKNALLREMGISVAEQFVSSGAVRRINNKK